MVFYRKYRPQKIEELDSSDVRNAIQAVLSLPEVPHAFLFTGPKGLGKTSAARIVAKAVNCETRQKAKNKKQKSAIVKESQVNDQRLTTIDQIEPCNECVQCISITNGTNLDILEIDAASNRGIDEIRDLRDKIKLAPVSASKKVYIIDEVHMLTTEAFNALLKTLEEPPAHAIFILCTTELHKIPSTIISRCFQVLFTPAGKDDIARSFKRIARGEGIKIDDEVIGEITQLAEGGFRDAHKIIEELVALGEKNITKDLVEKRYKVTSNKKYVNNMVKLLDAKDTKKSFETIQKLVAEGIDIKQFILILSDMLHQLLLLKAGVHKDIESADNFQNLSMEDVRMLLLLLQKAAADMKYSLLPQLPLELAVIEWCLAGGIDESLDKAVIAQTTASIQTEHNLNVAAMRKKLGDLARVKALYGEQKVTVADKSDSSNQVNNRINLLQVSNSEITAEWLNHFWLNIISEMKQFNHIIAGVLRGCKIASYDNKILIIETSHKFHKERLDDAKTRSVLEEVCKTLTGNPVKVEVRLKS